MPALDRETQSSSGTRGIEAIAQNVATYAKPGILAAYEGRPVRIIATGDVPGHSPVCQFIDEDGKLDWDSQRLFTIVDTDFLPPSRETLQHAMKQLSR